MVGVVGSSPIVPTKQKPRFSGHEKGDPKGSPFFVFNFPLLQAAHLLTSTCGRVRGEAISHLQRPSSLKGGEWRGTFQGLELQDLLLNPLPGNGCLTGGSRFFAEQLPGFRKFLIFLKKTLYR